MRILGRSAIVVLVLAMSSIAVVAFCDAASAHEHETVGPYEFIVGWRFEPAYVGVLNGLDLGIEENTDGGTVWVEGAEAYLTATITTGAASVQKALEPEFGEPGWYTFDVIPTVEGDYSVRLQGTLNSTAIDVTVPLDTVDAASGAEFPTPSPTPSELGDSIQSLTGQVETLQGQLTVAYVVAAIAIVLASVGVAVGWMARRKPKAAP